MSLKRMECRHLAKDDVAWIAVDSHGNKEKGSNVVGSGVPAPLLEERVIACARANLHSEFYQRDVTAGMPSFWKFLVNVVSKSFQEVVKVVQKLENAVRLVIGLGLICMEDVDDDAVWRALLNEVQQQGAHAPNCYVIGCNGYSERSFSSTRKYTARLRQE